MINKSIFFIFVYLLVVSDSVVANTDESALQKRVSSLADAYVEMFFDYQPERQTRYALPNAEHDRLTPNSLTDLKRQHAEEDALWAQVKNIETSALMGKPERVTLAYLRESLQAARAKRVCRMELWPVNSISGWQVHYPRLANDQPVDTEALRIKAIKRWQGLDEKVETEIENLNRGLELGFSSPKRVVSAVLEQVDNLLEMSVSESPFSVPATKEVPDSFKVKWLALVRDEIYPVLRRYRRYLNDVYLPAARSDISITAHPSGNACYRASYRSFTTLERSAKQVFEIGVAAVDANEEQLISLGKKIFGLSDPIAIRNRVKTDRENRFTSKEEMIEQAEEILPRAKKVSKKWFGQFPKGDVIVEAVPSYKQKLVTASYRMAPADGSRSAKYMINLYQPDQQQRSYGEITAIHEAYPGHHMQLALSNERTGMHQITKFVSYTGFKEGWARYSEGLADEMGLYQSDYARIGRLSWPARGMVVDAGIHGMGWSNQQALDFMDAAGTLSPGLSESLLDRIAVWPGQLAAYDTGGLEILALRRMAKTRLGQQFDIRDFHDRVLENGSVPLLLLRENIEQWVKSKNSYK